MACLCARTGRRSQDPCSSKTQTPGSKPTPPLPTGSGAHGLRGQVNAPELGVLASKHALAECGPNASVMKAAAAEVAHAGGPCCPTPGCSCRCCRARGTLGRRTPACRRAPQAPVKWWGKPLSRCAVIAMAERTQEAAPQGSAFGALARTDRRTRGAPFDRSRGASLEQRLTGGMSVCQNRAEKPRPLLDGQNTDPCEAAHPTPPNRVRRAWLARASECPCWRACLQANTPWLNAGQTHLFMSPEKS